MSRPPYSGPGGRSGYRPHNKEGQGPQSQGLTSQGLRNMRVNASTPQWILDSDYRAPSVHFADTVATLVLDPVEANDIWRRLAALWPEKPSDFPGSLAVSLMHKDLSTLKSVRHLVLPKTDSVCHMLFAFRDTQGQPKAIMMDRSCVMHEVMLRFTEAMYDGTLLDGELLQQKNEGGASDHHVFEVFDCVLLAGSLLGSTEGFEGRLLATRELVCNEHEYLLGHSAFDIRVKEPVSISRGVELLYSPEDCVLPIDGLVLVAADSHYRGGQDFGLFKYKMRHTVGLKAQVRPNGGSFELVLCALEGRQLCSICVIMPTQAELNRLGVMGACDVDNHILECEWQQDNMLKVGMWRPYMIREKRVPNSIKTVELTRQNIAKAIGVRDLIEAVEQGCEKES